jgi:hypothetical protein
MFNKKLKINLVCGLLFIFLSVCLSQELFAKPDLKVKGSIIAYYIAPEEMQGSFLGVTNILVIKVSKVLKGQETSKFIIVRFNGKKSNYFNSDFTENKDFKLELDRTNFCDDFIENLLFVRTSDDNKNIKKERSDLEFVLGANQNQIPNDVNMPCYFIK